MANTTKRSGPMSRLAKTLGRTSRAGLAGVDHLRAYLAGFRFADRWSEANEARETKNPQTETERGPEPSNPLREYFEANTSGPGIYKWLHYFEIYDRHLAKFVGQDIHLLEIGVFSGGSLGMWRSYFGPKLRMTGVDIEPACKAYENEHARIVIGDQEDRAFWRKFWAESPPVDVIIDDGGHTPEQQRVTLEECLPRLRPGGVFICEDIHRVRNRFNSFLDGLGSALNPMIYGDDPSPPGNRRVAATPFQARIHSIHRYPYVAVIETRRDLMPALHSVRRGSEWQPFL